MNMFSKTIVTGIITLASIGAQAELISLNVESAGFTTGNYVKFMVNDEYLLGVTNRRGINVVVIDQNTGSLLSFAGFDTYANSLASFSLASYIDSIDDGRYVMLAVRDEATNNFNEAARTAIQSIGGSLLNINGIPYRSSYALIGIAGSEVGTRESFEISSSIAVVSMFDNIHIQDIIAPKSEISSVPVPASFTLLGLAMVGFGVRRKSKS